MLSNLLKYQRFSLLLLVSCCAPYLSFAYDLQRADFPKLITLYIALFFLSWKFLQLQKNNLKLLMGAAFLFRLLFLFAIPNLSQDFYRFLWDGNLLLHGINPYLFTPDALFPEIGSTVPNADELLAGMGELSSGNHSNYPPLNQLLFALAAWISGGSILGGAVVLRLMIISADLGIFFMGRKLLKSLKLPKTRIFWYLLNPFIIIELTGNLHFEGVMVFFLLCALYLLHKGKWIWSALLLACAVSVKLIPLLFLPLLYHYFRNREGQGKASSLGRLILYYLIVALATIGSFLPFLSMDFVSNYLSTVGLWFQKFEFNASLYYVIRWIGYEIEGYNIIGYAGKFLALAVFLIVIAFSLLKRNSSSKGLITSMLFSICIYYFLATTVHPWYLVTPLILSIFTKYRFMLLWSLLVILSYFAYSYPETKENLWVVGLEYILLYAYMGYELLYLQRKRARPAPRVVPE